MQPATRPSRIPRPLMSALFILLLVLQLGVVNFVLEPAPPGVLPWATLSTRPGEVDVLVLGSSRAYCAVYPMEMWREAGVTAVDAACGSQPLPVTLTYLREALKREQPRVVMLEVSMMGSGFKDLPTAHNNLDYIPSIGARASSIVSTQLPGDWFQFFAPLQVYHSRWNGISQYDFRGVKTTEYSFLRGADYLTNAEPQGPDPEYDTLDEAGYQRDLAYVRSIIRVGDAAGARVVLFNAPAYRRIRVGGTALLERLESDLAQEFPTVEYVDMNDVAAEIGVDPERDYKDVTHVNRGGALKISRWLATYLKELGAEDQRDQPFASKWNDDLAKWDDFTSRQ